MKRLACIITLMLLCAALLSTSIELKVSTPAYERSASLGHVFLEPGVPMLPYIPVRILLPFGETVSNIEVSYSQAQTIRSDFAVEFARAQQPISLPGPDNTLSNPDIWTRNAAWPYASHTYLGTQYYRGHQIALLNVYPYRWNPVTLSLSTSEHMDIKVQTQWDMATARSQANYVSNSQSTRLQIADFVLNPETQASYSAAATYRDHTPQSRLIDLSTPKKMIIITDALRAPWFDEYVQWKASHGISTGVFLTSDIYSQYQGEDNAAKVRAFITDAYQTWAQSPTPLEYVILGGDDEIVPERGCYGQVGDTVDNRMPVDMYFSNLDGNWNSNGNDIYGEPADNVDMIPEVHIGRFPAETYIEFDNIFRKIRYYTDQSTFSNNISIMFGENLNWNPVTWGGDYKDDVALHIPETYAMRRHYERDGTYSASIVWNAINQGAGVMNHMGHANETYLMGQGNNTIQQLRNTEYGFLYSQGCYPAAFDQRTSGDGECIAEHMLTSSGGLFSFIGNTRYGWYMPGSINGASQYYDREYFIALFETLNTELGAALTYSRLQNLNAALSNDVMRWCYYEVVLFGDPSISVKYPDPSLPMLSMVDYTITDEDGDGDGSFNPGEILRFYPRIRNEQGWATAQNVTVGITGLPSGAQLIGTCVSIPELLPGQISSPDLYIQFQLPQVMNYGSYTFKAVLDAQHPVTNHSVGSRVYDAGFEITLIDNRFPWDCANNSKSAPIVYDFNNDDQLDIMYLDVFGQAWMIGSDGEQFGGFQPASEQNIMRSSAMGDITGDGNPELVVASRTGEIYASTLSGSPVFSYQSGSPFLFTPVLADIDGDGINEVLAHTLDKKLFALRANGTLLPGFPVEFEHVFHSELAAADLDADGAAEIVIGTAGGHVYVIKAGGTVAPGFPVNLGAPINGAPLVLENNRIAVGAGNNLVLLEANGSPVFTKTIPAAIVSGAVPADMNRDGSSEMIFTTLNGELFVVSQSGADLPGFPLNVNANFSCPPIIANLDGDVHYEILLHSYINSVYAFNHNGTTVPGFPFNTTFNGSTPGTLVDFDGDGILKLVSGYSTGVLVVNLRIPATNRMPWTMYRGGLERRGSRNDTGFVANDDPLTPIMTDHLLQNYPNPFNPSTTISFYLAKAGQTKLSIYNVKGQLVRELCNDAKAEGPHSIVWDGKDAAGRTAASGVYLYRLESPSATMTKRMLMLK